MSAPVRSSAPLLPGLQGLVDGPGCSRACSARSSSASPVRRSTPRSSPRPCRLRSIGNQWGAFLTLEAGLVQGLGAELVFLLFFYRRWLASGRRARGCGRRRCARRSTTSSSGTRAPTVQFVVVYLVSTSISGAVIAGGLSWLLARGLARRVRSSRFAAGREARARV